MNSTRLEGSAMALQSISLVQPKGRSHSPLSYTVWAIGKFLELSGKQPASVPYVPLPSLIHPIVSAKTFGLKLFHLSLDPLQCLWYLGPLSRHLFKLLLPL